MRFSRCSRAFHADSLDDPSGFPRFIPELPQDFRVPEKSFSLTQLAADTTHPMRKETQ